MNEKQTERLVNVDPQHIALAKIKSHENLEAEINQLVQTKNFQPLNQTRPKPEYEKLWFPTPETCDNPSKLSPLQSDIYDQILHFQNLEKIDPKNEQKIVTFFLKSSIGKILF